MEVQRMSSREFLFNTFLFLNTFYFCFLFKTNIKRLTQRIMIVIFCILYGINSYNKEIVHDLNNTIKLHNLLVDANSKVDAHIQFLKNEKTWFGVDLEKALDNLHKQLDQVDEMANGSYVANLTNSYSREQHKQLLAQIWKNSFDILRQLSAEISQKKKVLQTMMNDTVLAVINRPPELMESILRLHHSGIKLTRRENQQQSKFKYSALFQLRQLFQKLYHEETRRDEDCSLFITFIDTVIDTAKSIVVSEPENFSEKFPIADLKLFKIPRFLEHHADSISNFLPWVIWQNKRIAKKKTTLFQMVENIRRQVNENFEKLIQRCTDVYMHLEEAYSTHAIPNNKEFLQKFEIGQLKEIKMYIL